MAASPTKVIVAIHGVGDQSHAETIRSTASQFGDRAEPRLPLMPLGYFSVDDLADVKVSKLDLPPPSPGEEDRNAALRQVRFAEVYWADIPRSVTRQGDTIEEAKAWGRTIVSRAEAVHRRQRKTEPKWNAPAFDQAAGIIDEIVDSVRVIENVTFLADKMGVFKFDLAPLLRDYVNDVQVVTEFPLLREKILGRFHKVMAGIVRKFGNDPLEIYVVAHSEGTVVSFLAMLQALAQVDVFDLEDEQRPKVDTSWIRKVRGYMTFGSPIDKHLLLWEPLWDRFRKQGDQSVFRQAPSHPIDWRNYYDRGDPIGFELDTAREFLAKVGCGPEFFQFPEEHDIGFTRYVLPGKAHVDYWQDKDVFDHFTDHVVLPERDAQGKPLPVAPEAKPTAPPRTKVHAWLLSYSIPYLVVAALHLAAVFVLFRGLDAYLGAHIPALLMARQVAWLAAVLVAITVVGRAPRLMYLDARNPRHWVGMTLLLASAAGIGWLAHTQVPSLVDGVALAGAAVFALVAWLLPRRKRLGRHAFFTMGAIGMALYVSRHIPEGELPAGHEPFSILVLAGIAAFLLWRLGVMLFDLAFLWHRYIRMSVMQRTLHKWRYGKDPAARAPAAGKPGPQGGASRPSPMIPPDARTP